eukprot:Clim_evm36s236 gene=Clim_evmTU36s236
MSLGVQVSQKQRRRLNKGLTDADVADIVLDEDEQEETIQDLERQNEKGNAIGRVVFWLLCNLFALLYGLMGLHAYYFGHKLSIHEELMDTNHQLIAVVHMGTALSFVVASLMFIDGFVVKWRVTTSLPQVQAVSIMLASLVFIFWAQIIMELEEKKWINMWMPILPISIVVLMVMGRRTMDSLTSSIEVLRQAQYKFKSI